MERNGENMVFDEVDEGVINVGHCSFSLDWSQIRERRPEQWIPDIES